MSLEHLSASQIGLFLFCPLAYKYKYVDKLDKFEANIYTEFGSSIHKALEYNYKQKKVTRCDESTDKVIQVFGKELDERITKLGRVYWNVEELYLDGISMLRLYMKEIAPKYMPKEIERSFNITLSSIGVTIKGFVDLITEDGIIVDHKTAWSSTYQQRTQNYVDNMLQLTAYALAYRKEFWVQETSLRIDVLKRLKGWPKFASLDTTRTDIQVLSFLQLLEAVKQIKEQGLYYPNLANCSWCALKDTCKKLYK